MSGHHPWSEIKHKRDAHASKGETVKVNRKNWRLFVAAYALIGYNRLVHWLGQPTADRMNTALVRSTVDVLILDGWSVVRFDPNTENHAPGGTSERRIVVEEWT